MEDDTVTLRDRDTLEQDRVSVTELAAEVERRLG
jgi:glycyl-tRNA synthetase (class II)